MTDQPTTAEQFAEAVEDLFDALDGARPAPDLTNDDDLLRAIAADTEEKP